MKKWGLPVVILILAFLVSSGCVSEQKAPSPPPAAVRPGELRTHYTIGVDADFPPFTSIDSEGNFSGFDIDAARWVAARKGFDIGFTAVPWDTAVPALESGRIDILWSGVTVTRDRQARIDFTRPYMILTPGVAARNGSGVTMEVLHSGRLRIGTQNGSTEAGWVNRTLVQTGKMPISNHSMYPDVPALTGALANGAVDVVIVQSPSLKRAISGKPLVIIGEIPTEGQVAVAVRKNDTALLASLDHGLSELAEDPYWGQLKERYGLS
jgi:polar amino acid transport system substrate-binding protein